jgi:hypothetical protein
LVGHGAAGLGRARQGTAGRGKAWPGGERAFGELEEDLKERPIIFSGPMVRAILDGRKTQTRRVLRRQPAGAWATPGRRACPYGVPGDRLWVRETWAGPVLDIINGDLGERFLYRASDSDWKDCRGRSARWRPSIHMPRSASRLLLEITDLRVQRLQDITEEDARAEGVAAHLESALWDGCGEIGYRAHFKDLWDRINSKRGPWESDPWVWVLNFRRMKGRQR